MYKDKIQQKKNQPYFEMINRLTEELSKHKSVEDAKKTALYLITDFLVQYDKNLVMEAISEVLAIQAVRINFFVLKEELKNV